MSDTSMQCLCGGTICAAPGSWHEPHSCGVPPDHVIPDGIYETALMGRCDRCGEPTTERPSGDPRGIDPLTMKSDDPDRVNAQLATIVSGIVDAILDAGPYPSFHADVTNRHRREWPYLWRYLDALCILVDGQAPR